MLGTTGSRHHALVTCRFARSTVRQITKRGRHFGRNSSSDLMPHRYDPRTPIWHGQQTATKITAVLRLAASLIGIGEAAAFCSEH
jgi:hypothetical protein